MCDLLFNDQLSYDRHVVAVIFLLVSNVLSEWDNLSIQSINDSLHLEWIIFVFKLTQCGKLNMLQWKDLISYWVCYCGVHAEVILFIYFTWNETHTSYEKKLCSVMFFCEHIRESFLLILWSNSNMLGLSLEVFYVVSKICSCYTWGKGYSVVYLLSSVV